MAFVPDNKLDLELRQMRALLEVLQRNQRVFHNTFHNLSFKDRASMMKKIVGDQRTILQFIEKCKREDMSNSGLRFGIENLKNTIQAALTLWRRTEKLMEADPPGATSGAPEEDKNTQQLKQEPVEIFEPTSIEQTQTNTHYIETTGSISVRPDSVTTTGFHLKQAMGEADKAVNAYSETMRKMGHKVDHDQVKAFRQQVESALSVAKQRVGGKDLNVQVVQDNGKIKVKITAK